MKIWKVLGVLGGGNGGGSESGRRWIWEAALALRIWSGGYGRRFWHEDLEGGGRF